MKLGSIYISVQAKTDKLRRDLAKAKTMTGRAAVHMKNQLSKINFTRLGIAATAFGVAVAYGMKKAIDAASDLQEVQGKFDVVFKNNKQQAESMAKVLVDSYAMSTREAKQYLSSVQDLLVPMGMVSDAAVEMSNEVVKLAADLGSFNNLPTATVMLDIQSGLVGNFETMKKYGVILNETVVKQRAYNDGLWDGKGMVDANTKAQVAFRLMLEGSKAAIGDLERTQDSYANQTKKLAAQFEDLRASIGDKLLPVATEWVKQLSWMIKNNPQLIDQIGDLAKKSLTLAGALFKVIQYANLRSVSNTFSEGAKLAQRNLLDWQKFVAATFVERQKMVDAIMNRGTGVIDFDAEVTSLSTWTSVVWKATETTKKFTLSRKELEAVAKAAKEREAEDFEWLEQEFLMAEKNAKALKEFEEERWAIRLQYAQRNLSIVEDFEDRYKQSIMSMAAYEISIIDEQAAKYLEAGADKIAVEKWVASEIKKIDDEAAENASENMKIKLQTTADFFGSMAGLLGQFNAMMLEFSGIGAEQSRSEFNRQKNLNMAQATMSTAAGVAKVLATPGGYAGIIMGALIAAAGAVQIATISKQEYKYAKGGVFTNSMVGTATPFNNSVMGEAGPEAIMPLTRGPSGELGVKASGGSAQQPIINNYNINAIDSKSLIETMRKTPAAITVPLNEQMQRGDSALNSNIRKVAR